jgi:TP901 family phage tail tape measure protein
MASSVHEIAFRLAASVSGTFSKVFKQAGAALSGYQRQIESLNREAADVSRLIKAKEAVANSSRAYGQARAKVAELGNAMARLRTPSREMVAEFNRAKAALARSKEALDRDRASLRQLETATGQENVALRTLIQRQKELAAATDKARKAQEKQQRAQGKWAKNKETLAGSAGYASMAGAAMGAGILSSVNTGMEFQAAMSRVSAVSGATGEDFAKLEAQAKELGRSTVWSASQAAEGMQYLAMAGFKTSDILATMPGMLSLASAGQVELAEAADISSNILSGFGLEASEIGRVGDVLTSTFTGSNTSLSGLGYTMKYAAPVAKSLGASLEVTAAMAAKLGDAGIQGEMAGTALRSIMLSLATPTGDAAKTMEALGVSAVDADGNIRPMLDVLADLSKAMSGYSQEAKANITNTIFGTKAMGAAMILMEQAGSGALQDFQKSLAQTGTAEKVAGTQTDNLRGDFAGLSSAMEGMKISVFETLEPSLRDLTHSITGIIGKVQAWSKENPELTQKIAYAATAVAGLAAAALPLLAAFKTMQFLVAAVRAPFLLLNMALHSQTLAMIVNRTAMVLSTAATKAWAVAAKVAAVSARLLGTAMKFMLGPWGLVIAAVVAAVVYSKELATGWEWLKGKALELWSTFAEKFPFISGLVQTVFGGVVVVIRTVIDVFMEVIQFIKNVFTGEWDAAWQNVLNIFGSIWEGLKDLVKVPLNGVIRMVNVAIDGLNGISVDVPDWVPGMGGKAWGLNIPKIPELAQGGIATRSTLANIGEGREPEAVLPLSRLDRMLSNEGGGVNVTFSPVINVSGGGDVYAEVRRGLAAGQESLRKELERLLANQKRLSYS